MDHRKLFLLRQMKLHDPPDWGGFPLIPLEFHAYDITADIEACSNILYEDICLTRALIPACCQAAAVRHSRRRTAGFSGCASPSADRGREPYTCRLPKKTHMPIALSMVEGCAQSPRSNVLAKYASARRFFARLASEIFLSSLQPILPSPSRRFRFRDLIRL